MFKNNNGNFSVHDRKCFLLLKELRCQVISKTTIHFLIHSQGYIEVAMDIPASAIGITDDPDGLWKRRWATIRSIGLVTASESSNLECLQKIMLLISSLWLKWYLGNNGISVHCSWLIWTHFFLLRETIPVLVIWFLIDRYFIFFHIALVSAASVTTILSFHGTSG